MNHQDHVNLIKDGIPQTGGTWADLGSGQGAFTLALAECIGDDGFIYSVDRDNGSLRRQVKVMQSNYPAVKVKYIPADFTRPLDVPKLDGIVMANSLHYVADKLPVLNQILSYLKPECRLIIIEYNTDKPNRWVPHPLTYDKWEQLATNAGFAETTLLKIRPSSFLDEFFSAVSIAPPADKPEESESKNQTENSQQ